MFKKMIETINAEVKGASLAQVHSVLALAAPELRELLSAAHGVECSSEQRALVIDFVREQCSYGRIYLVEGRSHSGMTRFAFIDYDENNLDEPYQLLSPTVFDSKQAALSALVERAN